MSKEIRNFVQGMLVLQRDTLNRLGSDTDKIIEFVTNAELERCAAILCPDCTKYRAKPHPNLGWAHDHGESSPVRFTRCEAWKIRG